MNFDMETESLPAGRRYNWRKHIVIKSCTAIICVVLIIVCVKREYVNREENDSGYEPGLRGPDGPTGQRGAPEAAGHPGEPSLNGPTEPTAKSGPPGPAASPGGVETVAEGTQNLTASKGTVEGIIAGTEKGVVIIPLDSLEQRTISSGDTRGLAFNWQSRKVYWIEFKVGIKIANLDGSSSELLISETSYLCGIAVDQITGNFYYGVQGSIPRIQVCDSRGTTCVTVASGVNDVGTDTWDIAVFPSKGLMFWSSPWDERSVTRASMDGTNANLIEHIDDTWIYGLYSDEFTERLYWANFERKSIGYRDLNGNNRNVLLNTAISPFDIEVNGDTLYFGGSRPNGVYSVTSDQKVSSIANTTGDVHHIALYGITKVSSLPNPCKNSHCAGLCVLTSLSYKCL